MDDVIGPDEWREVANAATGVPPELSLGRCRALKRTGERCKLGEAGPGVGVCRFHGGLSAITQDQARRRIEMVRSAMFDELCEAALEAVETYVHIMRNGEKDGDRLRAADRVLQLIGLDDQVSGVPKDTGEQEDIDEQLRTLLAVAAPERLQRAIEVTSRDTAG